MQKLCKKCNIEKPIDEFYKAKGTKDGYRGECKKCSLENQSKNANKERKKEYAKEWYENNKEKVKRYAENYKDTKNELRRKKYANDEEYREKIKSKVRKYNKNNPHIKKNSRLKVYGLNQEEFDLIFEKQNKKCAICGYYDTNNINFFPVIDHCHDSLKVRGILCSKCNLGLGNFNDSIDNLKNAIKYLEVNNG